MLYIYIISIILFCSILIIYTNTYKDDNMIYEKSMIDNNYYWVRNMNDKQNAANTMATIVKNMTKLINHLQTNINNFPQNMNYIKNLISRTKKIYIMETPKDDKFTSYTINKGEKIVFCLRSKLFHAIHDINTIMYVVIHELSHIACPEYGHTKLFTEKIGRAHV